MSRLRFSASGKAEGVRLPSALAPLAWVVYLAAMTAYIYAFLDRPDANQVREQGADEALIYAGIALLHVVLGLVVGRRALIAPILPIVIAVPAGGYPGRWPEGPVWLEVLFHELFIGLPLVALGVAIRALADRRMLPRDTQVDWAYRLGRERRS